MSSDRNSPPPPSAATNRRRSSITSQTFQELFGRNNSIGGGQNTTSAYPGPITSAAAQAQRRRLSLTTIGLSGSPNQTSPFSAVRSRAESVSSANSGSVDESPFEDDPGPSASSVPNTPFARRLSFGARALRDVRTSNGNIGNSNGEGFNFAENLRSRAERSSISGVNPISSPTAQHHRAKSVTVMEPPAREMPKVAKVPDAFQERILKGDFYMD
jgi:hypothetical protein